MRRGPSVRTWNKAGKDIEIRTVFLFFIFFFLSQLLEIFIKIGQVIILGEDPL